MPVKDKKCFTKVKKLWDSVDKCRIMVYYPLPAREKVIPARGCFSVRSRVCWRVETWV